MTDRPILFSAPMIRALLEGRKTQTRRIIKPQPFADGEIIEPIEVNYVPSRSAMDPAYYRFSALSTGNKSIRVKTYEPRHAPGDLLWVRESWASLPCYDHLKPSDLKPSWPVLYAASGWPYVENHHKARPSIHLPRWASRITLEVKAVKVERLQEISEEDAKAEGAGLYVTGHGFITPEELRADPGYSNYLSPRLGFEAIWLDINGPGSWEANPWVAATSFTVHRKNIDALVAERKAA